MPEPILRSELHHGRLVRCHAARPADVFAMFREAVARAGGRTAVVDGELRWTYAELSDRVEGCAARLAGLGLAAGDRLALLLDNRADYLTVLLAAARLGLIAVPMNVRQRAPETAFALSQSGAAALLFDRAQGANLPDRAEVPGLRHWLVYEDEAALWAAATPLAPTPPDRAPVGEDDPLCILYTSGTTGRPKGAVLTHLGIVSSCLGTEAHLELVDGESQILAVPASHVTGIVLVLLTSVRVAGKVVICREFKARTLLELAQAEAMSYAIMVPAMYKLCLMEPDFARFDLSAWRVGSYGGAPMAEATVNELAARLPGLTLVNIYGSTETTSPAVMMPLGEGRGRSAQVGRALPHVDLVVMDEHGRECERGVQGEIWIAGPMTVPGYWDNPEASANGFAAGYWRSGDLGTMDAQGYVTVHDRIKDMINRGGFKVYSAEVENTLMAHPAVAEAVVVGRPCPVLGERVEAFVVVSAEIDGADLRGFCTARLSDYKVPDSVRLVPGPLPRNPNGKLLKTVVRGWLLEDS